MKLTISSTLSLPPEAITQTFAILGKRGSGKTNLAVVMAEEMHEHGLPFVAIDPVGAWYGLRSSKDGKGPGLSIPIFGGEHGDVPLERTAGMLIADLVVDERLSCVLDVSEFSEGDKIRFLIDFAERLFRRNRDPLHLFLEEADDFIPQRVMREQARLLGAWQRVVKRGRFRGLGATSITQRSAALNKDVLTQTETLFVFRTTSPQDRKAIEGWLEFHGQSKEVLESLPSLEDGECWVWSPHWLGKLVRVKIRRRETYDSGATPTGAPGRRAPTSLADVDLGKIRRQMAATVERAKATDPKVLQQEIARLRGELARKPTSTPVVPAVKERRVEIPVLKDGHLQRFERAVGVWVKGVDQLGGITTSVGGMVRELQGTLAKVRANGAGPPLSLGRRVSPAEMPAPRPVLAHRPPRPDGDVKLGLAQRKILTVLAQYPQGRTVTQVALLTGYAVGGGAFRNPMSALRTLQFIEGAGQIRLTAQGEAALGEWEPLPEPGTALLDYWMRRLGHAEREILRVLAEAYPRSLTVQDVARQTQSSKGEAYEPEGGAFRNPMSRLRTLELIEGRGEVRLSKVLVERVPA